MSSDDFVWADIETVADNLADLTCIQYERQKVKLIMNPCGENFEAFALLKQKCMEKDKYFIQNKRQGAQWLAFVCLQVQYKHGAACNRHGQRWSRHTEEYAHVHAKHDRCRGFKSVTLWSMDISSSHVQVSLTGCDAC
jgi:hypothetical protein